MSWWELFRQATYRMLAPSPGDHPKTSISDTTDQPQSEVTSSFFRNRTQGLSWDRQRTYQSARAYWQKSSEHH
ncbi:MAG: hypothetical protein F6K09_39845 [Merismopedia sp. SIO2A8]|nr:hypothetical protein [Merismopedia sp. SIO2A8]